MRGEAAGRQGVGPGIGPGIGQGVGRGTHYLSIGGTVLPDSPALLPYRVRAPTPTTTPT